MEIATKDDLLFSRDEKGELLPQEVEIDEIGKKVLITPMPRGELKRYLSAWMFGKSKGDIIESDKDDDIEIVEKHLVKPQLSKEDLQSAGKTLIVGAISSKILEISGLPLGKALEETKKKLIQSKTGRSNGPPKRGGKTKKGS